MSIFDDEPEEDWYYDPSNEFQRNVLQHASKNDKHALVYLALRLSKAIDAMDDFTEQDPKLSKSERIAIESDIEEAREAVSKACRIIPKEVTQDEHDQR